MLKAVSASTALTPPEVQGDNASLQFYNSYDECQVVLTADPSDAWDGARVLELNKYASISMGCAPLWHPYGVALAFPRLLVKPAMQALA